MGLNENAFRKWMVAIAFLTLVVAIVRLWIGFDGTMKESPRRAATLRGQFQ
ncbi:hypothetical protein [Psychromarinibacter sp. S121]|uniref:hypothetical protein n=1 Tax=Psychromarinibacter sp. S121 TaxID=3415127 RepID=UPI003C7D9B6D